jgi:D-alanyl-D-alanine carboxypeptidase
MNACLLASGCSSGDDLAADSAPLTPCPGGGAEACAELAATLQQRLDEARVATNSPGAVQVVVTPACGRWVGVSGESAPGEPLRPDHLFRIGSVTKTYVGAAVLQLASEGALDLDDPLEAWVPGFPGGAGITLRQLLNHTSGIYNYLEDQAFREELGAHPDKVWPPEALVEVAARNLPYFPPGEGWHYSNTNFILLGMILEKASGADLATVLRERLLDPLALKSTWLDGEEHVRGEIARGYGPAGDDVTARYHPSVAWAAGAMVASAADVAGWAEALYAGEALDEASRREMLANPVETDIAGMTYGLAVMELDPSVVGAAAFGHTGDIFGYHTQMLYLPEKDSVIVSIVNSDRGDPSTLTIPAVEVLLGTEGMKRQHQRTQVLF